jgi:hypothetical protein
MATYAKITSMLQFFFREYLHHNKSTLILIIGILFVRSATYLFDFPTTFFLFLLRLMLILFAVFFALVGVETWKSKILTLFLVITTTIGVSSLNLWKVPAKVFIHKISKEHHEAIQDIISTDTIISIGKRRSNELNDSAGLRLAINHTFFEDSLLHRDIQNLLTTGIIEVEKNSYGTLFIMDRFIDNGYGLFWSTNEQIEAFKKMERMEVNGYHVTNLSRIGGNWYYLSFT